MMSFREYVQHREAAMPTPGVPGQGQDDDSQVMQLLQGSGVDPQKLATAQKLKMQKPGTKLSTAAQAAQIQGILKQSKKSKKG